jgi:prevent-host-death family protein
VSVVTIHQAKTNLSRLIKRVANGDEVIIARGKTPVAKLVPLKSACKKRIPGRLKGKIRVSPEFFEPMTAEELAEWGIE